MRNWNEPIRALFPQMVKWRREFHMHPEISFQEVRTSARVAEILKQAGLEVRTGVGGRGVIGILHGNGDSSRTVALRADMDALPIQDEKTCEYRSTVPGVMHACGHDAHTAALLGVAVLLSQHRDEVPGRIVFLFQHAEEVLPGGAERMIEDGALEGVDAVYGVHFWTSFPVGVVALNDHALMAGADTFHIEVIGKGGHGGLPHETVDAIAIASHLVVNLQTVVSRQIDPLKSGVITIGHIQGGRACNVIAERCVMTGTIRTLDPTLREFISARISEVTEQTCRMYGATYRVDFDWGTPPLVNHTVEAHRMAEVARKIVGNAKVWEVPPVMAGEDFAYYLQQRPGAFCFVGAGNPERGIRYPHHHPLFDIDEEAMKVSAALLIETAMSYLRGDPVN
jgi:amidohydrolase